ncbi:hypothetical protein [Ideonella sp. A 288]|uniref:hypothetical protein n=1 Tax=Ideonella sp. A 288 TaxID=1962181 RepID=UPI0011871085|nr:hypothetical protein [Ideonella sp. A 288]
MRTFFGLAALAVFLPVSASAADLTATETRWLQGAWPVITWARETRLPLDIVVQPQPTPGTPPLAMAFLDGRCKLVLSMRGNPEAQATLDRIAPDLLDATLELMAAHELGHCRRHLDGAWLRAPSGFAARGAAAGAASAGDAGEPRADWAAERREEGYGDLVGLAWVQRRHPQHYPRLQAWLEAERSADRVPGTPHDTLAWVRLARRSAALAGASIFEAATRLWPAGLAEGD